MRLVQTIKIAVFAAVASCALWGGSALNGPVAYAAATPESCFEFILDTTVDYESYHFAGVAITDYYDHEANNPANPACPRDVEVPSTIQGKTVTMIHQRAFIFKKLTAVKLPNTIELLGGFAGNELTEVTIPASVILVNSETFSYNKLSKVTFEGTPDFVMGSVAGAFALNTNSAGQLAYVPVYFPKTADLSRYKSASFGKDTGGAIVNPSQVAVLYRDSGGQALAPALYAVGNKNGQAITDYTVENGPDVPEYTGDEAELDKIDAIMKSAYFTAGAQYSATAPALGEQYAVTPKSPYKISLTAGLNNVDFVYNETSASGDVSHADHPRDGQPLAPTGFEFYISLLFGAAVLTVASALVILRQRQR